MSIPIPIADARVSLDQLKRNLRNIIDTGRIISEAIKKRESEIEEIYKVK